MDYEIGGTSESLQRRGRWRNTEGGSIAMSGNRPRGSQRSRQKSSLDFILNPQAPASHSQGNASDPATAAGSSSGASSSGRRRRYYCHQCTPPKGFFQKGDIEKHVRWVSVFMDAHWPCVSKALTNYLLDYCVFSILRILSTVHRGERPYACNECELSFGERGLSHLVVFVWE